METPGSPNCTDDEYRIVMMSETSADMEEGSVLRLCFADEKRAQAVSSPRKKRRNRTECNVTIDYVCKQHARYISGCKRRTQSLVQNAQASASKQTALCETPSCGRVQEHELNIGGGLWVCLCSLCSKKLDPNCGESFADCREDLKDDIAAVEPASSSLNIPMTTASSASAIISGISPSASWDPSLSAPFPVQSIPISSSGPLTTPQSQMGLLSGPCDNPRCHYIGPHRDLLPIVGHGFMALCPRCYANTQSRPVRNPLLPVDGGRLPTVQNPSATVPTQHQRSYPNYGDHLQKTYPHQNRILYPGTIKTSNIQENRMTLESECPPKEQFRKVPLTARPQRKASRPLISFRCLCCRKRQERLLKVKSRQSDAVFRLCSSCLNAFPRWGCRDECRYTWCEK